MRERQTERQRDRQRERQTDRRKKTERENNCSTISKETQNRLVRVIAEISEYKRNSMYNSDKTLSVYIGLRFKHD